MKNIHHCAATLAANPAVIAVVVYDKTGRIVDDAASDKQQAGVWSSMYAGDGFASGHPVVCDIFRAHNARRAKMTHVAMDNAVCIRLLTEDASGETVAVVYTHAPGPLAKSLPRIMRAILRNRNKARIVTGGTAGTP